MKIFEHKLIKYNQLLEIESKLKGYQSEISSATAFVREIEKGNLEANIEHTSYSPELSQSLVSMRDQMKRFAMEERERNWVNEGLGKFVEILRSRENDTLQSLLDTIIQNLVSYLKANQGALFLINDDDPKHSFLEIAACYAYDRKKYLKKRVEIGEGLVGQVTLEKMTMYMTDIPEDFVKITSGLGEALPRNLLIVPLKIEDQIYGVVELASFRILEDYQIEFVEKLAESIASTIAGVKSNERTQLLLRETQAQAEEMRAQEEEMRQNLEELTSTQEGMERMMNEVQQQERFIKGILDSSNDMIVTINREYKVINCNKALIENYKNLGIHVEEGFDIVNILRPEERSRHLAVYEKAFKGEAVSLQELYKFEKIEMYLDFSFTPIRDEKGEIASVAIFAKNVTEITKAKIEIEASEKEIKDLLNTFSDPIMTIDRSYRLCLFNEPFRAQFAGAGFDVKNGFSVLNFFESDVTRAKKIEVYNQVFSGEEHEEFENIKVKGDERFYQTKHAPIYDLNGEVKTIAILAKDITDITLAKNTAQQQTEEIRAQEEELRQNMEELSATQEEMQRILTAVQSKEAFVSNLLNASRDSIVTIDKKLQIVSCNDAFRASYSNSGFKIDAGFDMRKLLGNKEQVNRYEQLYKRAFNGESFNISEHYVYGGIDAYFDVSYVPLENEGDIPNIAIFIKDVTALMLAKQETEKQNEAIRAQDLFMNNVLNSSTDMIVAIDRELKVINCNEVLKANYKHLGYIVDQGFDILKLVPPNDHERHKAAYVRSFAGETCTLKEHYILEDIEKYIVFTIHPIKNEADEVFALAIFAKDVTEITKAHKETEALLLETQQQGEELRAQEEELRQNMEELHAQQEAAQIQVNEMNLLKREAEERESVFNQTTILSVTDKYGVITFVNDKFCEISGYTRDELIGQTQSIVRHPDMPKALFKRLWRSIKKGEKFNGIIKNRAKDGTHYWVDATIVPIKNEEGKIIKYIGARFHIPSDELGEMMYLKQV